MAYKEQLHDLYNCDMIQSTTVFLDESFELMRGYTYDEFVNTEITTANSFLNNVTFTGEISDTTGLQYMNSRFYDSDTGRFLTQDTYTGNAYDPWTRHLYSYCGNNPVNFTDFTGHIWATLGCTLVGALAAVKAKKTGEDVGAAFVGGAITGGIMGFAVGATIDTLGAGTPLASAIVTTAATDAVGGVVGGGVGELAKQTIELKNMGAQTEGDYSRNYDWNRVRLSAAKYGGIGLATGALFLVAAYSTGYSYTWEEYADVR